MSMLIKSDIAYNKIKNNLSKNISNEEIKKLFFIVLDNVRSHYLNINEQNISNYDKKFLTNIIIPLIKSAHMNELLKELNNEFTTNN